MRSSAPAPTTTCSQPTSVPDAAADVSGRRLAELAIAPVGIAGSTSRSSPPAAPGRRPAAAACSGRTSAPGRDRDRGALRPRPPSPPRCRARRRREAGPRSGPPPTLASAPLAHARPSARSAAAAWSGSPSARAIGPIDARRGGGTRGRRAHDLQRLHEHLEPEPAGGAREAARRQDVRRTGGVVADDGRAADEHRAGVAYLARSASGSRDVQLEMLGCKRLGARQRLAERGNRLHRDVVISSNKRSDGVGQRGDPC